MALKSTYQTEQLAILPLDEILPSPTNPRKTFDETKLNDLADSIRVKGVLQPVIVRPGKKGAPRYELVAGERRYRASKIAEKPDIPAIVRELSDDDVLEIQTIENLQREDLAPMEEAEGFDKLIATGRYDAESLALKIGKSKAYVLGRLQLIKLCPEARALMDADTMTLAMAASLARFSEAQQKQAVADLWRWNPPTRSQFDAYINRSLLLQISGFPFKASDAGLVQEAGPCTTCPKNSKNSVLFPELEGKSGHCTDPACFETKRIAYLRTQVEKAKADGAKSIAFEKTYGNDKDLGKRIGADKQVELYDAKFYRSKPDDPKAVTVVLTSNRSLRLQDGKSDKAAELHEGSVVYMVPNRAGAVQSADEAEKKKAEMAKRKEELRQQKVDNTTRSAIRKAIIATVGEYCEGAAGTLLQNRKVLALFLQKALSHHSFQHTGSCPEPGPSRGDIAHEHIGQRDLYQLKHQKAPELTDRSLLLALIETCVLGEITVNDYHREKGTPALDLFAELLEIDTKSITKEQAARWMTKAERAAAAAPKLIQSEGQAKPKAKGKKAAAPKEEPPVAAVVVERKAESTEGFKVDEAVKVTKGKGKAKKADKDLAKVLEGTPGSNPDPVWAELAKKRISFGDSVPVFAARIGLSPIRLTEIESGTGDTPTVEELSAIAVGLGLPADFVQQSAEAIAQEEDDLTAELMDLAKSFGEDLAAPVPPQGVSAVEGAIDTLAEEPLEEEPTADSGWPHEAIELQLGTYEVKAERWEDADEITIKDASGEPFSQKFSMMRPQTESAVVEYAKQMIIEKWGSFQEYGELA